MLRLHQNQSIIISGESGAGKTMSTKHVLMYLAVMTSPRYCGEMVLSKTVVSMPTRVLASSPLLESLGNAQTTRNDNSSRFGKFIEVGFSHSRNRLTRAVIKTFLLEKSRVVLQVIPSRDTDQHCTFSDALFILYLPERPQYPFFYLINRMIKRGIITYFTKL